jgi:hypothetical protein
VKDKKLGAVMSTLELISLTGCGDNSPEIDAAQTNVPPVATAVEPLIHLVAHSESVTWPGKTY